MTRFLEILTLLSALVAIYLGIMMFWIAPTTPLTLIFAALFLIAFVARGLLRYLEDEGNSWKTRRRW